MGIVTQSYLRKPLYVDAVRVTEENFEEIAAWCGGQELTDGTKRFIKVDVHNPKNDFQTKAYVGNWILYTERGYKVYTHRAFHASFDQVTGEQADAAVQAAKPQPVFAQEFLTEDQARARAGLPPVDLNDHLTPIAEAEGATPAEEAVIAEEPAPAIISDPVPPTVVDVPEQEKVVPSAVEGKRVLSIAEQENMSPEEIEALIRADEVVLAQDIANPDREVA